MHQKPNDDGKRDFKILIHCVFLLNFAFPFHNFFARTFKRFPFALKGYKNFINCQYFAIHVMPNHVCHCFFFRAVVQKQAFSDF